MAHFSVSPGAVAGARAHGSLTSGRNTPLPAGRAPIRCLGAATWGKHSVLDGSMSVLFGMRIPPATAQGRRAGAAGGACMAMGAACRVARGSARRSLPPLPASLGTLRSMGGGGRDVSARVVRDIGRIQVSTKRKSKQGRLLRKQEEQEEINEFSFTRLIPLVVLSVAYVHHSTTGFVLPALLPQISPDLGLSDVQGASLTLGYTVLYALALIPVGAIADRVDRSAFLAASLATWSGMTMLAAGSDGFVSLLAARVGFAAAQAAQNPVCFSLIPELFPKNRSTAMSLYNVSIYLGRALSFGLALLSVKLLGANAPPVTIPLDAMDLSKQSILYLSEGGAAVTSPVFSYDLVSNIATVAGFGGEVNAESWRSLLVWLGVPGLILALVLLLAVEDPRYPHVTKNGVASPLVSSRFFALDEDIIAPAPKKRSLFMKVKKMSEPSYMQAVKYAKGRAERRKRRAKAGLLAPPPGAAAGGAEAGVGPGGALAFLQEATAGAEALGPGLFGGNARGVAAEGSFWDAVAGKGLVTNIQQVWKCKPFQAVTAAAAFNDVGGWALIAFQGIFYQRVYHLTPDVYAPLLAIVLPVGGIIGGVGGGYLGDYLSRNTRYGRKVMLVSTTFLSAPLIAGSFLAPDYHYSFALLLAGFAMSEAWRAPSAIIMRDVTPNGLGSTGTALHLCVRNLIGGLGPLMVTALEPRVGLQNAMLLVPASYLMSCAAFVWTESVVETAAKRAKELEEKNAARLLDKRLKDEEKLFKKAAMHDVAISMGAEGVDDAAADLAMAAAAVIEEEVATVHDAAEVAEAVEIMEPLVEVEVEVDDEEEVEDFIGVDASWPLPQASGRGREEAALEAAAADTEGQVEEEAEAEDWDANRDFKLTRDFDLSEDEDEDDDDGDEDEEAMAAGFRVDDDFRWVDACTDETCGAPPEWTSQIGTDGGWEGEGEGEGDAVEMVEVAGGDEKKEMS